MPQADVVPLEQAASSPRLAIVVALAVERECLEHSLESSSERDIVVVQSGPGQTQASRAARRAVADGAAALMSFGLAGALEAALEPGTVVLPSRIVTEDGHEARVHPVWRQALVERLARGFALAHGSLLSADRVLEAPDAKAAAGRAHGVIACDMESAAIAAVAAAAGLPFVALRVIADRVADRLPEDVASWIDSAGNARLASILAVIARPSQWRATCVLVRRFGAARRVLRRLGPELRAAAHDPCQALQG